MNISTYMLMKACARGTRQSQFIDELIEKRHEDSTHNVLGRICI